MLSRAAPRGRRRCVKRSEIDQKLALVFSELPWAVLLAPPPCGRAAGRRSRRAAGRIALGGAGQGRLGGPAGWCSGWAAGRRGCRAEGLLGAKAGGQGFPGKGVSGGSPSGGESPGGGDCRARPPVGRVAIPPGHQPTGEGCRGSAGGRRRLGRRVRLAPGALRAARDGALWSALRGR